MEKYIIYRTLNHIFKITLTVALTALVMGAIYHCCGIVPTIVVAAIYLAYGIHLWRESRHGVFKVGTTI